MDICRRGRYWFWCMETPNSVYSRQSHAATFHLRQGRMCSGNVWQRKGLTDKNYLHYCFCLMLLNISCLLTFYVNESLICCLTPYLRCNAFLYADGCLYVWYKIMRYMAFICVLCGICRCYCHIIHNHLSIYVLSLFW